MSDEFYNNRLITCQLGFLIVIKYNHTKYNLDKKDLGEQGLAVDDIDFACDQVEKLSGN